MKNKIPDDKYKEILESMPFCCVDLIIRYNKKILLVKRKNAPAENEWCVPGGRIYKNEKLEQAVVRKAKEETNLDVRIDKKLGVYETMFDEGPFGDLKTGVHSINIVFIVKPKNKNFKIKIDGTSSDYKWIEKMEDNFIPYVKEILKDSKLFD